MKPAQLKFRDNEHALGQWRMVRVLFDTLTVPIFETMGTDEIIYCNQAFGSLLGTAPENVVGQHLSEYGATDEGRRQLKRDLSAANGARDLAHPYWVRLKGQTGREVTARFDWLERTSEAGDGFGCLIVAQEADPPPLEETSAVRRVFYEIVERSGEAISVSSDDGMFLYRNRAHADLFGRKETPTHELSSNDFVTAEFVETRSEEVLAALESGSEWVGLIECHTIDGVKPIWARVHNMVDPISGAPVRMTFSHDYSDELTLRAQLVAAKQEAEKAKKAQQDLFFAISHDFRTILQAASLYLHAAERKAEKNYLKIEEIGRARDAVYSAEDHFQKIIDLLSKDASVLEPKIEYVRGKVILDYIDHAYTPLADAKGIRLSIGKCDDVFPTDPSLMKRILGNLVSNAIKFTSDGEINVECSKIDGREVFHISDTGIGIPGEYHERIFDQFFRVDPGTGEGLGVGLSITRHLCELLGHRLDVSSKPGKGSTFTLIIEPIPKAEG